ncbi:MAG: GWxTD domain-containing protein [Acidobacteriia bacterium]|nr:GWxTD domain-containing protein [Terriglobia bacterium]
MASFRSCCFSLVLLVCVVACGLPLSGQSPAPTEPAQSEPDPLKRPLPAKKKSSRKAEDSPYRKWLANEVPYIITDEERDAFKKLTNDTERAQFIEQFWLRRDPTPDTEENEYKDEYYRRKIYANENFSSGVPGWRTDRGRIFILHGAPDSIEKHPADGPYLRTAEEGGGQTVTYPFEVWRYRHIEGIAQEIEIEFVDRCGCGEYRETLDRSDKDVLLHIPNAGPTDQELTGQSTKVARFRGGIEALGPSYFDNNRESKEFDRLETSIRMNAPPPVKFKELSEVVSWTMRSNLLPFDVRVDFVKAAEGMVLVPITLQIANHDLSYQLKDGVQRASVNLYGRVTTLTGKIVHTFEEPLRLDVPAGLFETFTGNVSLYQQVLPMRPGRYRLDLVVKDVNGDKLGTLYQRITVPDFSGEDKLAASTPILADMIEPASMRNPGNFVLGVDKVRPRVPPAGGGPVTFTQGQPVKLWMQVYNLAIDPNTSKPSASVEYQIVDAGSGRPVLTLADNPAGGSGSQITLQKTLTQERLPTGVYRLTIRINDLIAHRLIAPETTFAIQ